MELEAENWWLQSIGCDFDGKKTFIKKYYYFLVENFVAEKNPFFLGHFCIPIVIYINYYNSTRGSSRVICKLQWGTKKFSEKYWIFFLQQNFRQEKNNIF